MCSTWNKLSNKTNVSSLNPSSGKKQIFKARVTVSYFLRNFENLQRFLTGEPWPWRPWTWCPQGVFEGKLSFKKMSAGGRLCAKNSHFWVLEIKVKAPGGTYHDWTSKLDHLAVLTMTEVFFWTEVQFFLTLPVHPPGLGTPLGQVIVFRG